MNTVWHDLIANLAIVALVITGWTQSRPWVGGQVHAVRRAYFGLFMGAGAIASMLMSIELQPGVLFDLRLSILSLAGFFGGPVTALVSGVIALAYRASIGGMGFGSALIGVFVATGAGIGVRAALGTRRPVFKHLLVLGVAAVAGYLFALSWLPAAVRATVMAQIAGPSAAVNFVSILVGGLIILQNMHSELERELLRAALDQAPDYAYVKNARSEFAAVNEATAHLNGYARPAEMIGKTDFDLTSAERAAKLFAVEQELLAKGGAVRGIEEHLIDRDGEGRWFSTSKVALRDRDGDMIGIAGVTRDVTEEKRMHKALEDSRNQLSFALAEMADGLAMFDKDGYLVFSNQQYLDCFPLTAHTRLPGVHIREMLASVLETGEQITAPTLDSQAWVDKIEASLHNESDEEVALQDGRWLQLRTRSTRDGASLVVVSDITNAKRSELALRGATEQLEKLANTDGLTGLLNRRAFDSLLEDELKRSTRSKGAISLLMIDVDRFKAYNDLYGHPAGDECLRLVSWCLQQSVRRPTDHAARYGGEEFVVILADTDEDGAYLVAENFRKQLRDLRLPHGGSEKSIVTASVGVATYATDDPRRSTHELITMADEALYSAKTAGRDRVFGWRSSAIGTRAG